MNNENFVNALDGIEETTVGIKALTASLKENFKILDAEELLSLPSVKYNHKLICGIAMAAFEDNIIHDFLVREFSEHICHIPCDCKEYCDKLESLIDCRAFTQEQLLVFSEAFERMYAAGFRNTKELILKLYRRVKGMVNRYNPFDYTAIRVDLACIAYSCYDYNYPEKKREIDSINNSIKYSGADSLSGMVHFYKGLCKQYTNEYCGKDTQYHMIRAASCAFPLASIYLDHHVTNFETPKDICKCR